MIRIYGASDDLVEIEAPSGNDELPAWDKPRSILVGTTSAGVVVRAQYAPKRTPRNGIGDGPTWQMSVDLVDADVPIPWPVSIKQDGYSVLVEIDCPSATKWRPIDGEVE